MTPTSGVTSPPPTHSVRVPAVCSPSGHRAQEHGLPGLLSPPQRPGWPPRDDGPQCRGAGYRAADGAPTAEPGPASRGRPAREAPARRPRPGELRRFIHILLVPQGGGARSGRDWARGQTPSAPEPEDRGPQAAPCTRGRPARMRMGARTPFRRSPVGDVWAHLPCCLPQALRMGVAGRVCARTCVFTSLGRARGCGAAGAMATLFNRRSSRLRLTSEATRPVAQRSADRSGPGTEPSARCCE